MSDLLDPALLELHEGGCIANEFLVRAPEDAYDQILVDGVTTPAAVVSTQKLA